MLIAPWPLIIMLVGYVLFVAEPMPKLKLSEVGKWMCIVGMFWLVYKLANKTFTLD